MEELSKTIKEVKKEIKSRRDEKEEIINYVSYYSDDNFIYEQCYYFDSKIPYFVKWNKKEQTFEKISEFKIGEERYQPINDEELKIRAVILPSEPLEYENDDKLDEEIIDHIHRWLDVDVDFERFACYNIKLSWVYERFNSLSYTRALGDTGTGKSRFLFTLGHLHYKPMVVAGCLTPAVIFRIFNKWKGSLLIDEGDQKSSEETNSFIKIMNCGYEKGMPVSRCNNFDSNKLEFFDVFCPKVITTRKRFDDKATESRCMTSIMKQTFRTDIFDNFNTQYYKDSERIRNKLLLWRLRNYDKIDPDLGLSIDLNKYEPRLRQVNRAFISLFGNNPERLSIFYKHLDNYQESILEERATSFDGLVVNSLAEMIGNGYEIITPADVKEHINSYKNEEIKYPITAQKVSMILKGLGIVFQRRKVDGKTKNLLVFEKNTINNVFSRYVVDENILENLLTKGYEVTRVTTYTMTLDPLEKEENGKGVGGHHIHRNPRNLVTPELLELSEISPPEVAFHLEKFGRENMMKIEDLKDDLSLTDEYINRLLKTVTFFEPKPGYIKLL